MRFGVTAISTLFAAFAAGACGLDLAGAPAADGGTDVVEAGMKPERDATVEPPASDASQPDASAWVEPAPRCDLDPTLMGKVFPKRSAPITIDGSLADWSNAERWEAIRVPYSSFEPTVGVACAEFAARWDDDALYVAMRVADPIPPSGANDPTKLWLNDAVEVFVGPSALMGSEGIYTPSDSQVLVDRNGLGLRKTGTSATGPSTTNYPASRPPIEWVARNASWGYVVEFKIQRSVWGVTTPLQAGDSMRFMAAFDNALPDRSNKLYYLWSRATNVSACSSMTELPNGYCCADATQGGPYCNTRLFETVTLQ